MKGKKAVVLMCITFILPVLAAKIVLDMGWFTKGVTNNGELLSQEIRADWLDHTGQWRLIYALPEKCDAPCQHALFQLNQIPVGIGRERNRVASILLLPPSPSLFAVQGENISKQVLSAEQQQAMLSLPFVDKAIYLVDPLNNLILAYPLALGKSAQITQSKGLFSDLRKLMKLSKVG